MSKKRKIISLAVLGVLLLASLALSLLLGKGGAKESLQTIMRDAVLHEDNKISLFGLMDVNPAVVSGFIVTGVLLVLAALAAAGRILFGPIPDFKPVSAIAIIAGATLGRRNGFMVGALAALTSNFFFGQGMWTPWQMYAWGLVGYVGGALAHAGAFDRADGTVRMPALMAYGFASGLLYGVVINAYDIIGFVQPLTWAGVVARLATAVPFDITHGLATCVFLAALYKPWCRRINRVVVKYGL